MRVVQTSDLKDGYSRNGMALFAKVVNEAGELVCKAYADFDDCGPEHPFAPGEVRVYHGRQEAACLMQQIRKLNDLVIMAYYVRGQARLAFLNDPSDLPVKEVESGSCQHGHCETGREGERVG